MKKFRYIIRESTLYVRPIIIDNKLVSAVKELNGEEFYIYTKPINIIEQTCFFYHTTYIARKDTTRVIANICHKPPIAIKPETNTYLFPSHSDRVYKEQHWFNLGVIKEYIKSDVGDTTVIFDDLSKRTFPVSHYIFNNQFLHAVKLEFCLRSRALKDKDFNNNKIDYNLPSTNIYEVLAMYALLNQQV